MIVEPSFSPSLAQSSKCAILGEHKGWAMPSWKRWSKARSADASKKLRSVEQCLQHRFSTAPASVLLNLGRLWIPHYIGDRNRFYAAAIADSMVYNSV